MAVGFDSIEALDNLWEYHRQEKLGPLLHELLVTSSSLKAADVLDVTLVTKLWDDEYESCKQELLAGTTEKVDIINRRMYIGSGFYLQECNYANFFRSTENK